MADGRWRGGGNKDTPWAGTERAGGTTAALFVMMFSQELLRVVGEPPLGCGGTTAHSRGAKNIPKGPIRSRRGPYVPKYSIHSHRGPLEDFLIFFNTLNKTSPPSPLPSLLTSPPPQSSPPPLSLFRQPWYIKQKWEQASPPPPRLDEAIRQEEQVLMYQATESEMVPCAHC